MKVKPYPKTKPSGIEWLGDIPEHWEVKRLKAFASYKVSNVDKDSKEGEIPVRLCNYTDVYYNDLISPDQDLMEATATADEIKRFRLKPDDIVITKDSEDWRDIAIPARVARTSYDLVCGYHLAIVSSERHVADGSYLLRSFQSKAINCQFQVAASGVTRYGLPKPAIGEAVFPLPSLSEQKAIAAYLDRETGRIDELVEKKRTLIERLKEKRSALISACVTRGLPSGAGKKYPRIVQIYAEELQKSNQPRPSAFPADQLPENPPLKPSGIEWLGDIPTHWEVITLRRICVRYTGGTPDRGNDSYWEDGTIPWINSGSVNQGTITEPSALITEDAYRNSSARWVAKDSLVMALAGQGKTKGMVAQVGISTTCNQSMAAICPAASSNPRHLYWLLVSQYEQIRNMAGGEARDGLNLEILGSIPCLKVPLSEQKAIAEYLDVETAIIDALVAKVETAIERLREYRSALISAAVTGKIDVRKDAGLPVEGPDR